MVPGIEELIKKLDYTKKFEHNESGSIEDRILSIITQLKTNPQYSKCTEDDLRSIAMNMIANNFVEYAGRGLANMLAANGKPVDPLWSQFTYEEILGMANDGVNVPQEFLDWANAMSDSDTTSYELADDSSSDSNIAVNLEAETDENTRLGIQKKLQRFSSQAEYQNELLNEKSVELQQQNSDIESMKNELKINQKLTIDKINQIANEFNNLNARIKSGETLSATEMSKFKEYGSILNTQGQELVAQSKNIEADLNEFMSQVDEVNAIVDINKSISDTIERLNVPFAESEGGKNYSYVPSQISMNTFGPMSGYAYAAQSKSVALTAGIIGINLDFDSDDLLASMNLNKAIADDTLKEVENINSSKRDMSPKQTQIARVAEENNGTEKTPADTTQEEDPTIQSDEDEVASNDVSDIADEDIFSDNISASEKTPSNIQNSSQTQTEETQDIATGGLTLVPDPEEENMQQVVNQSESPVESPDIAAGGLTLVPDADPNVSDSIISNSSVSATSVNNTEEPSAVNTTEETQNVEETEDEPSTAEAENSLEAIVDEYMNGCSSRSSEMEFQSQNLNTLRGQIRDLKSSQSRDNAQRAAEFNSAITKYEELLSRMQSQDEISDADMAEYRRLDNILKSETGTIAQDMQSKITVLNEFSSTVENGLSLCSKNIEYANTAIEFGKSYALQDSNVDSHINAYLFAVKGKEKIYDMLYGKSGESLGRDLIDTGEGLETKTQAAQRQFVLSGSLSDFSSQYSSQLTEQMNTYKEKYTPLSQDFSNFLAVRQVATEGEGFNNTSNTAKTSSDNYENREATAEDIGDAEKEGVNANKSASDAKKEDNEAVKDSKDADKENKNNTKNLKKSQNEIKGLNSEILTDRAELEQLNQEAEQYNKEIEELSQTSEDEQTEGEQEMTSQEEAVPNVVQEDNLLNALEEYQAEEPSVEVEPPVSQQVLSYQQKNGVRSDMIPSSVPYPDSSSIQRNMNSVAQTDPVDSSVTRASRTKLQSSSNTTKRMNSTASVSNSSGSSDNSSLLNEKTTKLAEVTSRSAALGQRITTNGTRINTITSTSKKNQVKLEKTYKSKIETSQAKQKNATEEQGKTQTTIGKINDMSKMFGYTAMTGAALLLVPFMQAVGTAMLQVGFYGQAACHVTNAALNIADGNWKGAFASLGAAVVSSAAVITGGAAVLTPVVAAGQSTATIVATSAAFAAASAGLNVANNALIKASDKKQNEDSEKDNNRKTFVRFERQKVAQLKKGIEKIKKGAYIK